MKTDSHFRDLVSGAGVAFSLRVVAVIMLFLVNLIIARSFTVSEVGLFFLSLSIVEVVANFSAFGTPLSSIAIVGGIKKREHFDSVADVLSNGIVLVITCSVLLAFVLYLSANLIEMVSEVAGIKDYLLKMIPVVPFTAMTLFFGGVLRGRKKIFDFQIVTGCIQPAVMLSLLVTSIAAVTIDEVPYFYLVSCIVSMSTGLILVARGETINGLSVSLLRIREIVRISFPLMVSSLCAILSARTGVFILGIFSNTESVAIYSVCYKVSMLMNMPLVAIASIAAPKFAALHAENDRDGLVKVIRNSVLVLLVTTLPVCMIVISFPDFIMGFFGDSYIEGRSTLIILVIAQLVNVGAGPVGMLLAMTGNERSFRNFQLVGLFLTVISSVILVQALDEIGPAIGTLIGVFFINLLSIRFINRTYNVNLFGFNCR